ncbi:PepSY-associated TM helix domain-containing protein [Asticcacaulis biprosthecium]|uniref:PepSY-associated TM helix domain-containing protein n=1 Tax=Asticcacaulis biprosthecium TaxID=76891 RepID=UPI00058C1A66|nr:PepSY-associated TM helix domain-containing protein [Asticcacaulis biprosthecium]
MSSPSPVLSGSLAGFWRNQLRQWHWISSALCLVGLLLFSVTGFTLNHASQIEAQPKTQRVEKDLSEAGFNGLSKAETGKPVPAELAREIKALTGADVARVKAEVSEDDIYIDLTGPGVDTSVTIDKADGHVSYERTDRGVIAVLNDLHKGRNTGAVWSLFIDILAIACVIFSVTGFGLLWLYAKNRRITWPLAAAGLVIPFILFMVFVHA